MRRLLFGIIAVGLLVDLSSADRHPTGGLKFHNYMSQSGYALESRPDGSVAFLDAAANIIPGVTLSANEQEKLTLTSSEVTTTTQYEMVKIALDKELGRIDLQLKGSNGERVYCAWTPTTTPTGASLITPFNKADFSSTFNNNAATGSLTQRVHYRLFSGGLNEAPQMCGGKTLTGTMTGSVP